MKSPRSPTASISIHLPGTASSAPPSSLIDQQGSLTLSQFRDHFDTSRKYAQAALEQMDRLRYTRRVGDDRRRGPHRPKDA